MLGDGEDAAARRARLTAVFALASFGVRVSQAGAGAATAAVCFGRRSGAVNGRVMPGFVAYLTRESHGVQFFRVMVRLDGN